MKKSARIVWTGGIKEGGGLITTRSGVLGDSPPDGFNSRFEGGNAPRDHGFDHRPLGLN